MSREVGKKSGGESMRIARAAGGAGVTRIKNTGVTLNRHAAFEEDL